MKSARNLLALALMFFVFAVVFSLIFWSDISIAAKMGMFALGFGSGVTFGGWFTQRNR
jgi:hypothetical protein